MDDACPKHEAYSYDATEARRQTIQVGDQTVDRLIPRCLPDFKVHLSRLSDGFLFIVGEEIPDDEDEEDETETYGITIVAKRCA